MGGETAVQAASLQKVRYEWVDALKFLGIFAIYLGHLGVAAGSLYPFVFQYHVALFFWASGFFAPREEEMPFWPYLKKKICSILLPYFAFSLINLAVDVLAWGSTFTEFRELISAMFMGVRTQTVAAALWFLPCLFVIQMAHYLLKKLLRKEWLVLIVCIVLYVVSEIGIPYRPVGEPQMFFGIDSAMCYILYFSLGALLFPCLREFRFRSLAPWAKGLYVAAALFCAAVACVVYFKGPSFPIKALPFTLPGFIKVFYSAGLACVFLFMNLIAARFLARVPLFTAIGRNTLILCGTESLLKESLAALLSLAGLKLQVPSQFAAFVYAFFLLWLSSVTVVPWIRRHSKMLSGTFRLR